MKALANRILAREFSIVVFLVCALAPLAFFSGTQSASAHNGDHTYTITADGVDPANGENVGDFVLHIKAHWEDVPRRNVAAFTLFKNETSREPGDWRKGTLYTIRVNKEGRLVHQPYQPLAEDGSLYDFTDDSGKPVVKELIDLANLDGGCVDYVLGGESRVACSAAIEHPVYPSITSIIIGGLHHGFDDVSFAKVTCPYYVPEITAAEVTDRNTLKQFVEEFADYYVEQRTRLGGSALGRIRPCWRTLPWKYGSIYMFFT